MNEALKLGVAGVGTVGAGLLSLLAEHGQRLSGGVGRRIEVVAVSARDRRKKRSIDLAKLQWFDDPVKLAAHPGIDVFVELIGGEEGVARQAVEAALAAGK